MNQIAMINRLDEITTRNSKKITVLVGGCFDVLHYGHIQFLLNAKKTGDTLIVALESDQYIIETKKRQPVHSQMQRARILSSLRPVDIVVLLPRLRTNEEYFEMVKKIKPAIIATTKGDSMLEIKKQQAKVIGAKVEVVSDLIKPFSSSYITNYATLSRH